MHLLPYPVILLGSIITLASCESSYSQNLHNRLESLVAGAGDSEPLDNVDKRPERYAFGLGRRAYTYTSGGPGVKRLPVYNFGLGKRASGSRPYSFGLGKRTTDDEYPESDVLYDILALQEKQHENNNMDAASEKRARPYSFGLGKRQPYNDDSLDRRSAPQRYNFGLGKR